MDTKLKRSKLRSRLALGLVLATTSAVVLAGCSSGSTGAKSAASGANGSNITIGLSIGLPMNSYHKVLLDSFKSAANQLKKNNEIRGTVVLTANGDASTQLNQINQLVLKGVSAIAVDPVSPTALNSAISTATSHHIPVVVFNDGPVTSKDAYELEFDLAGMMKKLTEYVGKRLDGHGNVLNIRGVAGSASDVGLNNGVEAGLKEYSGLDVVSTIYGGWDDATTQSKLAPLLPGLPKIDGVIQQGGEGWGTIQAFQAAGRQIPLIVGGNRGNELKFFESEYKKNGYTTLSAATNPGIGSVAAIVAADLANGKKAPKTMKMPYLSIDQKVLAKYAAATPIDGVATQNYDSKWVTKNLYSQK